MYTIIGLLLIFGITIFSILFFIKIKQLRKNKLLNGICPSCNSTRKEFKDSVDSFLKEFFGTSQKCKDFDQSEVDENHE